MPRMRNLRPEFFTDEDLPTVSPHARLLFAGLWTVADRDGRLEDRPLRIHAQVFPHEPGLDIDALLNELVSINVIIRYISRGARFISVRNFVRFQTAHKNEKHSELPAPPKNGSAQSEKESAEDALSTEVLSSEIGYLSVEDESDTHDEVERAIGHILKRPVYPSDTEFIERWSAFDIGNIRRALQMSTSKDDPMTYADAILRNVKPPKPKEPEEQRCPAFDADECPGGDGVPLESCTFDVETCAAGWTA